MKQVPEARSTSLRLWATICSFFKLRMDDPVFGGFNLSMTDLIVTYANCCRKQLFHACTDQWWNWWLRPPFCEHEDAGMAAFWLAWTCFSVMLWVTWSTGPAKCRDVEAVYSYVLLFVSLLLAAIVCGSFMLFPLASRGKMVEAWSFEISCDVLFFESGVLCGPLLVAQWAPRGWDRSVRPDVMSPQTGRSKRKKRCTVSATVQTGSAKVYHYRDDGFGCLPDSCCESLDIISG